MDQFVRVIRSSIHQHLQGPLWEVLQKSLMAERSSIDDLESAHNEYLEKVLARYFKFSLLSLSASINIAVQIHFLIFYLYSLMHV